MTIGEMQKWTQRFNRIVQADPYFKNNRLSNMKNDIELAYPGLQDGHAAELHEAVLEEMGELV
ncbi:MAG TPA: hypothetical protein VK044_10285 [Virgibacillus sp.]|nr:hypothetical protein [Virgibacillus sp.]